MIVPASAGSRLAVGSSARMTDGDWASARAMPTRCCSPPDSVSARRAARRARPTCSRHARAAARSASGKRPSRLGSGRTWPRRPASTLSSTDARRTRLNCWKIMPTCRRASRSAAGPAPVTSRPATRTVPEVGSTSRLIERSSVVFPAPLRPRITTNSPGPHGQVHPVEGRRGWREDHAEAGDLDHGAGRRRARRGCGRSRARRGHRREVGAQRGRMPSRSTACRMGRTRDPRPARSRRCRRAA